jgi:hypothetical protein
VFYDRKSKVFQALVWLLMLFLMIYKDGLVDLIVVGEWMKPTFFENKKRKFTDVTASIFPEESNGL